MFYSNFVKTDLANKMVNGDVNLLIQQMWKIPTKLNMIRTNHKYIVNLGLMVVRQNKTIF